MKFAQYCNPKKLEEKNIHGISDQVCRGVMSDDEAMLPEYSSRRDRSLTFTRKPNVSSISSRSTMVTAGLPKLPEQGKYQETTTYDRWKSFVQVAKGESEQKRACLPEGRDAASWLIYFEAQLVPNTVQFL